MGDNLIKYLHNFSKSTSYILTVKCLINIVISIPIVKLCGAYIKDFYLNTPMDTFEYMRINASLIPKEITKQYQLVDKIRNIYLYM